MIKRRGLGGFVGNSLTRIKGLFRTAYSITSVTVDAPNLTEGLVSIIISAGQGVSSPITANGQGLLSTITATSGFSSIMQTNGQGVTSKIIETGQGVTSS